MAHTLSDSLIRAMPDLTLMVRYDGVILSELGGRDLREACGDTEGGVRTLDQLWDPEVGRRLRQLVRHALKGRTPLDRQYRHADRWYEVRLLPQGIDRVLMVFRELPAGNDAATPESQPVESRGQLLRRLTRALSEARLRERPLAVVTTYLGGLTDVERAFDVTVAEQLAAASVKRLRAFMSRELAATAGSESPATQCVAPIADHVLAAVIEKAPTRETLRAIVQRMGESLAQPFDLLGRSLQLSPAFGIAFAPEDGMDASELLNRARSAMYDAHHAGRVIAFHSDTLRLRALNRLDSEHELRWALEHEHFQLDYLPLCAVSGARLVAVQAQPFWAHPVRGHVAAEEFLALAETSELARGLGRWMLSRACGDLARVPADVAPRAIIRLCRRHLLSATLLEDIMHAIAAAGVDAQRLALRITERAPMVSSELLPHLRELRAAGVQVIVERFGAVHIAMDRIAALPVDVVSLDPMLVRDLQLSERTRAACRGAIDLAHAFGWQVAAEVVTSREQLELLQNLGCDLAGGEIFGAPRELQRLLSGPLLRADI